MMFLFLFFIYLFFCVFLLVISFLIYICIWVYVYRYFVLWWIYVYVNAVICMCIYVCLFVCMFCMFCMCIYYPFYYLHLCSLVCMVSWLQGCFVACPAFAPCLVAFLPGLPFCFVSPCFVFMVLSQARVKILCLVQFVPALHPCKDYQPLPGLLLCRMFLCYCKNILQGRGLYLPPIHVVQIVYF